MKLTITKKEDIHAALDSVFNTVKAASIYYMIAEELLVRLFDCGQNEITVGTGNVFERGRIQITGRGPEVDLMSQGHPGEADPAAAEEEQLTLQIGSKVLSSCKYCVDKSYADNRNRYVIRLDRSKKAFENEILEFYKNSHQKIVKHPLSLIWWFINKRKLTFGFSFINKIIKHEAYLFVPLFTSAIIDDINNGIPVFSAPVLLKITGAFFAIVLNLIGLRMDQAVFQKMVNSLETDLKKACVKKLNNLSLLFHHEIQSGRITAKLLVDTENIRNMLASCMANFVDSGLNILTAIVIMLFSCPSMLIFYLIMIPLAVFTIYAFRQKMHNSNKAFRKKREHSNASVSEMLGMEYLTRAYGIGDRQFLKISEAFSETTDALNRYESITRRFNIAQTGLFQVFQLICFSFAVFMAARGSISIGMVIIFNANFTTIVNGIVKLLESMGTITSGYESLNSLNEILCINEEENNDGQSLPPRIDGRIEFKQLTFSYPDSDRTILDDISLEIPAGSSAAFIGESGSGKSTLMNLVIGLLKPVSGSICVDGYDLSEVQMESYRRHIAVVPQNSLLFSGTLWDNLVFGLDYITTAEVSKVISRVGLQDFVDQQPDGLYCRINEQGANLSGGQKQRIAIARALLRDPEIILLDEATSALDNESEKLVQKAIDEMMKQCTVIMIAHRLTTIKNADQIYRIRNGKAEKVESYESLMRK